MYGKLRNSSHGYALEYLESSSCKVFVYKLCVGENGKGKKIPEDEFHGIFNTFYCGLSVYYLSEGFKACLESFWS